MTSELNGHTLPRSNRVRNPAPVGAYCAAWGAAAVSLIILALHAIKPEFEPAWRFVSEYAIGQHGWIMKLAFLIWSASACALALALRREMRTAIGRAGVVVLFVVVGALAVAGVFAQDPVTAKPEELTTHGTLHAIASMIGIPGIPVAAMLTALSLSRANPHWLPHRPILLASSHATWISLLAMAAYLMWSVPRSGGFSPEVWAGGMNRLVVATYLAWQWVVATRLIAIRKAS